MKQQEMAVVIATYDGYQDVWELFVSCLDCFWGRRNCNTYFITNCARPPFADMEILTTGPERSWSHRIRTALEKIPEAYVLLLLEDYLLSEPVDPEKIEKALAFMQEEELDYLRITTIPKNRTREKHAFAAPITDKMQYSINLQASIWRKSYLLALIGTGDISAWELEAMQQFGKPTRIPGRCYAVNQPLIQYLNGIIQGKWNTAALARLREMGMEMSLGNRGAMSRVCMLRHRVRVGLKEYIPSSWIRVLKPVAKKLGLRFVT